MTWNSVIPLVLGGACFGALVTEDAEADVAVLPPLGDHMVLQREKPVMVSGTSAPDKEITIVFNGQTKTTKSSGSGTWHVNLDAMPAKSEGGLLTVSETGSNSIVLSDVVVGDVWICAGQSNMAFTLSGCDRREDIAGANFPAMRQFSVPMTRSDVPLKTVSGNWSVCNPQSAPGFSAVAFYFGRKICQDQDSAIPIGLYVAAVGGTRIDPWLAPEGATDIPALAPLYGQSILPWGPFSLFNGMIHPYAPLQAKGLIWYQGENSETTTQTPDSYFLKMKALSEGYRRLLGADDMAFYFVQLANWGSAPENATPVLVSGGWDADTRIQQANANALPHSGMASAIDIGEAGDMHPRDKADVGERLALWALKNQYGRKIAVAGGPILSDVVRVGSSLVCSFDQRGSGLMVGSKVPYHPTVEAPGEALRKFSVAGASGDWFPANAVIHGDTVVVSSPSVAVPCRVSYACSQNPAGCNLYNREGLPASPFLVDDVDAKFRVAANAGNGGRISPDGKMTYLKRKAARYTITPAPGFFVEDIKVDGVSVGSLETYTFDPIYADHTIAATFSRKVPHFTISASSAPGGAVVPAGEISVKLGDRRGFHFEGSPGGMMGLWIDGKPVGRRDSHTFGNIRRNHTITTAIEFPINTQAGYGGTITPAGAKLVAYGADFPLEIVPLPGFSISKVAVDGVNVGAVSHHTLRGVTSEHSVTASFKGNGRVGSIPKREAIYCSFLTDSLPKTGDIGSWPSYIPPGKALVPQGSVGVKWLDGRKFVENVSEDADCLDLGIVSSAIPCKGATVVVVAKPTRTGADGAWNSIVDFFHDRLILGIMNGSGRVVVRRNGSLEISSVAIPDGQTTILSLVVQIDGTYRVYANGSRIMEITTTSDMSAIVPGIAGGFANHVTFGRNWPDRWSTFNGTYGDIFVHTTALTDTERQQLEAYLATRLGEGDRASPFRD